MNILLKLARRNLLVFLRDGRALFFSFLGVFIIIGLYALFLGDTQMRGIQQQVGKIPGIRFLVDSWMMGGLIAANAVSISLGALNVMVKDQDKKVIYDFLISPINRFIIVLSYLLSAIIIGVIISVVAFMGIEAYIFASGGELLTGIQLIKVLGVIVLSVIFSSSLMFFIASFVKSSTTYASISTITGSLLGFVAGIYLPIGYFPESMQFIVKIFPISHCAAILRQIFMDKPMNLVFGANAGNAADAFKLEMGVNLNVFGIELSQQFMLCYVILWTLIFISLSIFRMRKLKSD